MQDHEIRESLRMDSVDSPRFAEAMEELNRIAGMSDESPSGLAMVFDCRAIIISRRWTKGDIEAFTVRFGICDFAIIFLNVLELDDLIEPIGRLARVKACIAGHMDTCPDCLTQFALRQAVLRLQAA